MRRRSGKHDTVSTALVGLYCSSVATIHHLRFPTSLAALSVCEGMAEEVEGIHRRASRDGPPGLKSGGKKGGGGQRDRLGCRMIKHKIFCDGGGGGSVDDGRGRGGDWGQGGQRGQGQEDVI